MATKRKTVDKAEPMGEKQSVIIEAEAIKRAIKKREAAKRDEARGKL
jgi:hypothetical protein